MRKHTLSKLLSYSLAFALAFTSVIPAQASDFDVDDDKIVLDQGDTEGEDDVVIVEEPVVEETKVTSSAAEDEVLVVGEGEVEEVEEERVGESATAKLTIHYLDEKGNEMGYTYSNPHAGDVEVSVTKAQAMNVPLKDLTTTLNRSYYSEKWIIVDAPSVVKTNDAGTALIAAANSITADEISVTVRLVYTPFSYTIKYYAGADDAGGGLSSAIATNVKNELSTTKYPHSYIYSEDSPLIIPVAPSVNDMHVSWKTCTVTSSGETETVNASSGTSLPVYADAAGYYRVTVLPDTPNAVVTIYAKYVANADVDGNLSDDPYAENYAGTGTHSSYFYDDTAVTITQGTNTDGKKIVTLDKPSINGYTFEGWFRDAELTKAVPKNTGVDTWTYVQGATDDGAVNFYSKWSANVYNIELDKNTVSGITTDVSLPSVPSTITYKAGETIKLGTPVRAGYTFDGWTIGGGTTGITGPVKGVYTYTLAAVNLNTHLTGTNSDTFKFVANWSLKKYDIELFNNFADADTYAYIEDGGNAIPMDSNNKGTSDEADDNPDPVYTISDAETPEITPASIYLPKPTRSGFAFGGWYTNPEFSGTALATEETIDSTVYLKYDILKTDKSGLKFYAKWNQDDDVYKYAPITYILDGGKNNSKNKDKFVIYDESNPSSIVKGGSITIYAPSKDGYIFDGWYTDSEFKNELDDTSDWKYTVEGVDAAIEEAQNGVTFYAKWKVNPNVAGTGYAVVYEPQVNGYTSAAGNVISSVAGHEGEEGIAWTQPTITNPITVKGTKVDKTWIPELTKKGYVFNGWYTLLDPDNEDDKTYITKDTILDDIAIDSDNDDIKDKVILHVDWEPITYRITFHSQLTPDNTNVKEFSGADTDLATQAWGVLAAPFKVNEISSAKQANISNYDSSVANMAQIANNATKTEIINAYEAAVPKIAESRYSDVVAIDLYANWAGATTDTYTLKYDANCELEDKADFAGSAFSVTTAADLIQYTDVVIGQSITLTGREFVRKGYTLSGWTMNGQTIGATDTINPSGVRKGDVVVLKAIWKADKAYTLKLNLNGGKYAVKLTIPKTYTYDNPYTLPTSAQVTRAGYTFAGWYDNADFSGTPITKVGKGGFETGEAVLYAAWNPYYYKITFDTQKGSSLEPAYGYYGYNLYLAEHKTVRDGYKFKCWSTTVNGKKKTFKDTAVVKNLTNVAGVEFTFTAEWTPIKYSISYDNGKGAKQVKQVKSYTPDKASSVVINLPTLSGNTFGGYEVYYKEDKAKATDIAAAALKPVTDEKGILTGYTLKDEFFGNIVLSCANSWVPTVYTIELYDGSNMRTFITADYTQKVNFTDIAKNFVLTDTTQSVKGFGFGDGKVKYVLNKTYDVATIAKDLKIQDDATQKTIKLYAVTEPAKYFVTTSITVGTEAPVDTTYNFDPKKGYTIKAPKVDGYTFSSWTVTGGTKGTDYTIDAKTGTITIPKNAAATANKMTFATTLQPTKYTVYIMPNADGAKYGTTAITKKDGYKYATNVAFNTTTEDLTAAFTNLKINGKVLVGFSTTSNVKNIFVKMDPTTATISGTPELKGLKADKNGIAKVYAIWQSNTYDVVYDPIADVINKEGLTAKIASYVPDKAKTYSFGKALTLPKLKIDGYKFLGWKLVGTNADVTVSKAGYATKIGAKNAKVVQLKAVLQENTYKLSVNPNGGTYKGNKKAQVLNDKVRYSEDISDYLALVYGSDMVKTGYKVGAVYTVAKPKDKDVMVYAKPLYSKKAVTLYPQWVSTESKVTPYVSATYNGTTTVNVKSNVANVYNTDLFEIEVSRDITFGHGTVVKTGVTAAALNAATGVDVTVTPITTGQYYVRVRRLTKNGTDYIKGEWLDTVSALKATGATMQSVTISYSEISSDGKTATSKGSKTVSAVAGEPAKDLTIPALEGFKNDGKLYSDAVCTKELTAADKVTSGKTFYTKVTGEITTFKLIYDMGSYTVGTNEIDMNKVTSKASTTFTKGTSTYTEALLAAPSVDEEYGFEGWYTDAALTTKAVKDAVIGTQYKDVTLHAKWVPYTYTVELVANYEGGTGTQTGVATFGAPYVLPTCTIAPPAGKVFDRWELPDGSIKSAGTKATGLMADKKDGKITIKATWRSQTDASLNVYFVTYDGTKTTTKLYKTFKATEGTTISSILSDSTKVVIPTGYTVIKKYYEKKDIATGEVYEQTLGTSEVVGSVDNVYVKLEPVTYTVSYSAYGSTGGSAPSVTLNGVSYMIANDKAVAAENTGNLVNTGYKFAGWNTENDGSGITKLPGEYLTGLSSTNGAAVVLYPIWKPITYKLVYYPNGATNGIMTTVEVTYGDPNAKAAKAADLGFSKVGYTFGGWTAVVTSGSTGTIAGDDPISVVSTPFDSVITEGQTVRMYAIWNPKTLSSIAVKTDPTNKVAYVGQTDFNAAGLVITLTYSDSTTEDVAYSNTNASAFTFTFDCAAAPKYSVTYNDGTTSKTSTGNAMDTVYDITGLSDVDQGTEAINKTLGVNKNGSADAFITTFELGAAVTGVSISGNTLTVDANSTAIGSNVSVTVIAKDGTTVVAKKTFTINPLSP